MSDENQKEKYKKSHNDYWVEPQVFKALEENCNILEADIWLHNNKIMIAHAWKLLNFQYFGSLDDYLSKMKNSGKEELWLQIEFKTADQDIHDKLGKLLSDYNNKTGCKLNYLIYGKDQKWTKRGTNASNFFKDNENKIANLFWWDDWKKDPKRDIETVDLFNAKYEKLKKIFN